MRNYLPKFIFVGVLVLAAFLARACHYTISESAADVAHVTMSSGDVAAPGMVGAAGPAFTDRGTGSENDVTSSVPSANAGTSPFVRVGTASAPALDYHEALIADIGSGAVLWGDADGSRWPLASVTKLMTAVIATENLSATQTVTITPQMAAVDPGDVTLKTGDTYTVSDLLHIMLLKSSNVAAEGLASVSGRTQFLGQMNAHAVSYGMHDTYYYDPSGLSSANQSTADDLLLLAQKIYADYPQILAITRQPQATVTNQATGKKLVIKSINDFAGQADFLGGKTGYTDVADGNLLSIFKYENRPILVVIMGTDDAARFQNTTALYNWFKTNFK